MVGSPKMPLAVVWNMFSFGVFGVLPKGTSFDTGHCRENIPTNFGDLIFFLSEEDRTLCPVRESTMSAN
jgi:hypothetical protein